MCAIKAQPYSGCPQHSNVAPASCAFGAILSISLSSGILAMILAAASSSGCGGGGGGTGTGEAAESTAEEGGARQLFVSTDGSDEADGSSTQQAFRTIQRAAAIVRPGDQVNIHGGTYDEVVSIRRSGTSDAPIVFTSVPGETAVIDGGRRGREPAVFVSGKWIILRALVVTNGGGKGILIESGDNVIDGVTSHHNGGTGIQVFKAPRNLLIRCVSHSNVDRVSSGEDGDGISISGDANTVIGCRAYNNSDDGLDAWQSTNTTVERSVAHDNGGGARGDGNGFKLSNLNDSNSVIRKSIAYRNLRRGFTNNGGSGHSYVNNTAWSNRVNYQSTGPRNNTFINNVSFDGALDLSPAREEQHNSWNLEIGDPEILARDPDSPDFLSPRPGSVIVDKGLDVGLPFAGAAQDLGALELGERITDLLR